MSNQSSLGPNDNSSVIIFILSYPYIIIENKDNKIFKREGVTNSLLSEKTTREKLKLSFIGDSLIGTYLGHNYEGKFRYLLENNDYKYPFRFVKYIFKEDDYTIANGENVFSDENLLPIEKNYSPAYWYIAPSRFANVYKESSIEVVSVMNNHSNDYGSLGYSDTKKAILDANLILGAEEPVILEKYGVKIGLICTNLFHRSQYDKTIENIKKIRNEVNYIIIYFHGGTEYLFSPTDEIVEYSHGFIDNGADLVIGAHPHVLEPREKYKNKTIIYSLGSFLFSGAGFINRTIIYQMNLIIDNNTIVEEYDNIIPCYLYTLGPNNDDYLLPSPIRDPKEKQKVIDFMNNLVDKPN